jgi:hypothetical protein
MAQKIVGITAMVWFVIASFAVVSFMDLQVALLPLYGLYPGEVSSGGPGYHPAMMHAWAVGAGFVFLALGLLGVLRESKPAAVAFLVLFVLSTFVLLVRLSSVLSKLH